MTKREKLDAVTRLIELPSLSVRKHEVENTLRRCKAGSRTFMFASSEHHKLSAQMVDALEQIRDAIMGDMK